jgi:hypothetical protein
MSANAWGICKFPGEASTMAEAVSIASAKLQAECMASGASMDESLPEVRLSNVAGYGRVVMVGVCVKASA